MSHQHTAFKKWAAATALLCALLCAGTALAAEVSAQAEPASVQAGDTVTLTITVTGDKLGVVQGEYTYDPTLLTYTESDGGAADGYLNLVSAQKGGADSLSARITFTAAAAGEAKVDFTLISVLGYDGKDQSTGTGSVSVTVTPGPAPEPEPAVNYAETGVKAQNVQNVIGDMYIWKDLENVTIPTKYSIVEDYAYHEEKVTAVQVPDSDAPTLLYLSDAAGDNAGYYVYVESKDLLYPYSTLSSVSKSYILLQPDESVAIPEGFTQTTLTVNEKELTAWSMEDAQGTVYLLYARNPSGELGFYFYSPDDESLQRYAVLPARPVSPTPTPAPTAAPTAAPEPAPAPVEAEVPQDSIQLPKLYLYGLCALAGLLFIVLIITLISHSVEKKRRRQRALERRAAREAMQNTEQ